MITEEDIGEDTETDIPEAETGEEPAETDVERGHGEDTPTLPAGTDIELAPVTPGLVKVTFTQGELDALRDTIGADMSDSQFALFVAQSKRLGLDPISRQCYGWVDNGKLVMMTSIDGLRVVCDRTGRFRGMIGPQWCGKDRVWTHIDEAGAPDAWLDEAKPMAARVGILHADYDAPVWGIATLKQYGKSTGLWSKGGAPHMLAKCAEAIARRQAFPQDLAGVYTDDEIDTVTATRNDRPRNNQGRGRRQRPTGPASTGSRNRPAPKPARPEEREVEAAMAKFNALPDEGREKVEQRWQTWLDTFPDGMDRLPSIDDGGLFEAEAEPFAVFARTIDMAIEHWKVGPFPCDDDDIVVGEIVEDDDEGAGEAA